MKTPHLYLHDILQRIDRIERYSAYGEEVFLQEELLQDAVIRNFEVIGEAVKRLPDDLKTQQPHVEWHGFAGFRDVLIHQYDKVDMTQVWMTIQEDLPALKRVVTVWLQQTDSLSES
jgi:uncharacterized protein with HEPN domain